MIRSEPYAADPGMWTQRSEQLDGGRVTRITFGLDGTAVSYADVLRRWQIDAEFRLFFLGVLADSPYSAFRWESPPITRATAGRPFEFVMLDSPGLARAPDEVAFQEHFSKANRSGVVEFP